MERESLTTAVPTNPEKCTELDELLMIAEDAVNCEEYFYCVLSFLQSGIKFNLFLLTSLTFPQKLYIILNHDETIPGIIEWCLKGQAFRILNKDRFLLEIIPRYFNQKDFRSFERQLNVYGFDRFRYETSSHCYRHPLFLRNRVEWISTIVRHKPKFRRGPQRRKGDDLENMDDMSDGGAQASYYNHQSYRAPPSAMNQLQAFQLQGSSHPNDINVGKGNQHLYHSSQSNNSDFSNNLLLLSSVLSSYMK